MKKKKSIGNLDLSDDDIKAILCALPLVASIKAETPEQDALNVACCTSAAEKLLNRSPNIAPNEIRVISAAITAAIILLSGKQADFIPKIDAKEKEELSKYFFIFNRLDPIFQNYLDYIYSQE